MLKFLFAKLKESFFSVLPIVIIVLVMNFTITPVPIYTLVLFLISAAVLIIGITLFSLGVDTSLITIGSKISTALVKTKRLFIILLVAFLIGVFITVAEPDLKILTGQIPTISANVLILAISIGVGTWLLLFFIKVFFQIKLNYLIIGSYLLIFILALIAKPQFVSIAFEAGGVTTGPILVPFIMAIGIGLMSVKNDKLNENNSFGLVAMCLIGPVVAVLVLSFFTSDSTGSNIITPSSVNSFKDIFTSYKNAAAGYFLDVFIALLPMVLLFLIFQFISLKLDKKTIAKIFVGLIYTYIGLVLFLMSANLGLMSIALNLGEIIVTKSLTALLIPLGMVFGFFIVSAEPAVQVLKHQIEDATDGAISAKSIGLGLSLGVAVSVGLSLVRVIYGIPLLWILLPGYGIAIILSFVVPSLFTAIAFDSGAVASGPLAATFLLPFAIGASAALGGNVFTDAFGIVATVALTPVIVIQSMGAVAQIKNRRLKAINAKLAAQDSIIEYELDQDLFDD